MKQAKKYSKDGENTGIKRRCRFGCRACGSGFRHKAQSPTFTAGGRRVGASTQNDDNLAQEMGIEATG